MKLWLNVLCGLGLAGVLLYCPYAKSQAEVDEDTYGKPSATSAPASQAAPRVNVKLNPQEANGESLFIQRCNLCHVPKLIKPEGNMPSFGPSLNGILKSGKPELEAAIRTRILKGSVRMPGFEYALDSKQVDDLMAYLKTLQ